MNVGLVDVDSKIPNLALMKLSAWHKAQGDDVELAFPLSNDYDLIYRSKVFDFSPDDRVPWSCEVISGGTGYSLNSWLPCPENTYPDYDLFGCTYALGRLTRGCIRRCPFCIVWKQDGKVRQVAELDNFWRGQTHLKLLDDNLTAMPELFVETCRKLATRKIRTSFEALDVRLLTDDMCEALVAVPRWGNLRFAWDDVRAEAEVVRGIECLKRAYPSLHDVLVYVLIGYDSTPEDDLYRIEKLRSLGAMPFAMPYARTEYTKRLARYVNHKAIFKSVSWADYRLGMGHGKAAS